MADATPRAPTVFLSYASQDREAARRLGDALPGYGIEVWYDESELGGGDAWDQKIRRQIRECDYFMPLISAQTEARHEGYFRREWRLAVERTLDMADDHPFLLPVVLDDTDAAQARVPEKFFAVQWLKVPDGAPNAALEALGRRLASGEIQPKPGTAAHPLARDISRSTASSGSTGVPGYSGTPGSGAPGGGAPGSGISNSGAPGNGASASAAESRPSPASYPAIPFPVQSPGQGVRFAFEVFIWSLRSLWVQFKRLPRWVRYTATVWLVIAVWPHSHSERHDAVASAALEKRLNALAAQYQKNPTDLAKFGAGVAKELDNLDNEDDKAASILAMPFTAPAGDADAARLADAAFAQTYTRISLTQHATPVPGDAGSQCDRKTLVARGEAKHARYVLCGIVEAPASAPAALTVMLIDVNAASEVWSGHYPVSGADAAKIAQDVAAQLPKAATDD